MFLVRQKKVLSPLYKLINLPCKVYTVKASVFTITSLFRIWSKLMLSRLHFDRMHSQKVILIYRGQYLKPSTFSFDQNLSIAINVLAAAGDLLIAASLCTILHLSRTGSLKWGSKWNLAARKLIDHYNFRSDTMINTLVMSFFAGTRNFHWTFLFQILFSVNTGLLIRYRHKLVLNR